MSTKAELEKRIAELEAQAARGIPPDSLRMFSFVYSAGSLILVSAPPGGSEELAALKAALGTLTSLVDRNLLDAVAREAKEAVKLD